MGIFMGKLLALGNFQMPGLGDFANQMARIGKVLMILFLDGAFKYFLFVPLFREGFHFDEFFWDGLKPPTSFGIYPP